MQLTATQVKKIEELRDRLEDRHNILPFTVSPWPNPPAKEAFYGLAGKIVQTLAPYTEADNVALLVSFLLYFGNVIGRNACFVVGADRHYTNEFAGLVGPTGKGRKGTADNMIYELFRILDEDWTIHKVVNGLSSGEGLIWAVRDEVKKVVKHKDRKTGDAWEEEIIVAEEVPDKRLLIVEPELASALKVMNRHGNSLSPVVRTAWDRGNLQSLTKNSPAKATGAHISIIGHITVHELQQVLTETEKANGLANRFIWFCVKRARILPDGAEVPRQTLNALATEINEAVQFAKSIGKMERDAAAQEVWRNVYPVLSEGRAGLMGAVISRAEAHVLRLSMLYALLDLSQIIRVEHLKAALALWEYAEESCRYIFGGKTSNSTEAEILGALESGPMSQTEIYRLFDGHLPETVYKAALESLYRQGLITYEKKTTKGRPTIIWQKAE